MEAYSCLPRNMSKVRTLRGSKPRSRPARLWKVRIINPSPARSTKEIASCPMTSNPQSLRPCRPVVVGVASANRLVRRRTGATPESNPQAMAAARRQPSVFRSNRGGSPIGSRGAAMGVSRSRASLPIRRPTIPAPRPRNRHSKRSCRARRGRDAPSTERSVSSGCRAISLPRSRFERLIQVMSNTSTTEPKSTQIITRSSPSRKSRNGTA